IHMSPQDARLLNVSNGQKVSVRSHGERQLTFDEVVVRVRNDFALELHIDTEEANAAGLKNGAQVTLIR
ncbi:PduL/EutD family phosphate acyltransferase, partial [Escherichia coli]|nr:PduL/EutD family phosphate acyltransferase [Escherichia coli]